MQLELALLQLKWFTRLELFIHGKKPQRIPTYTQSGELQKYVASRSEALIKGCALIIYLYLI